MGGGTATRHQPTGSAAAWSPCPLTTRSPTGALIRASSTLPCCHHDPVELVQIGKHLSGGVSQIGRRPRQDAMEYLQTGARRSSTEIIGAFHAHRGPRRPPIADRRTSNTELNAIPISGSSKMSGCDGNPRLTG